MPAIYHQFVINGSIEKVFHTISNAYELEQWWPLRCTGHAELGEPYDFYFGESYDWHAEVVHCDSPNAIYYKMTKADEDWQRTTFGFELTSIEKRVKVNFSHKDWPHENEHFKIASFCWAMLLNGLKRYVEDGIVVPFSERE